MPNPQGEIKQRAKAILERGIALDLAANVPADAAKTGSELFFVSCWDIVFIRLFISVVDV
jgi:hypothetical protein